MQKREAVHEISLEAFPPKVGPLAQVVPSKM